MEKQEVIQATFEALKNELAKNFDNDLIPDIDLASIAERIVELGYDMIAATIEQYVSQLIACATWHDDEDPCPGHEDYELCVRVSDIKKLKEEFLK